MGNFSIALVQGRGVSPDERDLDAKSVEQASSLRTDGEFVGSEVVAKYVTPELAYVVEIERGEAKVGGEEEITPYAVRSTMIFRPEDDALSQPNRYCWSRAGLLSAQERSRTYGRIGRSRRAWDRET